jgi:uncharacterized protein with gpF-like domain
MLWMVLHRPVDLAPETGQVKFYKGRSQEKHPSNDWNFSCFAAPVNEQDGF